MCWKIIRIAAVFSILCSIDNSLAAGIGGEAVEKELQKFQGTWGMVSGERDGKKVADQDVKQSRIVYEDKTSHQKPAARNPSDFGVNTRGHHGCISPFPEHQRIDIMIWNQGI
jgi:hypothetical protein